MSSQRYVLRYRPCSHWAGVAIMLLLMACGKSADQPTRPFLMGFTPFPYAVSNEAVAYTYQEMQRSADIVNQHFDSGVPWEEAFQNIALPQAIQNDWQFRRSQRQANQKVLLSLTPINFNRDGLALRRGAQEDMPLLPPWDSYDFNHPAVKTAFLNYCRRGIDYFSPDYFLMGVEVNLLMKIKPTRWAAYLELHQYVYTELKKSYPNLPVAVSVTGIDLLAGYTDVDIVAQRKAFQDILPYTDFVGVSFYAYQTAYTTNPMPTDMWDKLYAMSDKPFAITETGYPAQQFSMFNNFITFYGTLEKQNAFITGALEAAARYRALFVINFVLRDYDALWLTAGGKDDITIAWRDTGLIDENGAPRTAYNTWLEWRSRQYRR